MHIDIIKHKPFTPYLPKQSRFDAGVGQKTCNDLKKRFSKMLLNQNSNSRDDKEYFRGNSRTIGADMGRNAARRKKNTNCEHLHLFCPLKNVGKIAKKRSNKLMSCTVIDLITVHDKKILNI